MKVLSFIVLGALLFGLAFSARVPRPKSPAELATVYLADTFHGEYVSVHVNDELIFYGRVVSEEAIQHAATLPLRVHTSPFTLRIEAKNYSRVSQTARLEQKIDCDQGPYLYVVLKNEELYLLQEATEPEFY